MTETAEIITHHISAFNLRNADAETWAVDAEMIAPGVSLKGRENVLGFLRVFQEAFPDGRLEVKQMLTDGTAASVEGLFLGTHNGVLHSAHGDIPPTGKSVEFRWAAAYEVRGSELLSEHLYFDQMDLMGQLGLLPA